MSQPLNNINTTEHTRTGVWRELITKGFPVYDPRSFRYTSIVLFDEVERSSQELHNLMLSILDDGIVTLASGTTVYFYGSIIFLTSNVGSRDITTVIKKRSGEAVPVGFVGSSQAEDVDSEIYDVARHAAENFFQAEFLNRIDCVEVARPHNAKTLAKILLIFIKELDSLFLKTCPILLKIDASARQFILREALDRPYENARILHRKFQDFIVVPLSRLRATGQIQSGDFIRVRINPNPPSPKRPLLFQKLSRRGSKKLVTLSSLDHGTDPKPLS